jgi:hypothetical protein
MSLTSEQIIRELALKRYERDQAISANPHQRDPLALAERSEWDDRDQLCQDYLAEAKRDWEAGAVTDFQAKGEQNER